MAVELLQTQRYNIGLVVEDGILLKHEVSAWASDINTCTSCNQITKLPEKAHFHTLTKRKPLTVFGVAISYLLHPYVYRRRFSLFGSQPTVPLLETGINWAFCRHDNAIVV